MRRVQDPHGRHLRFRLTTGRCCPTEVGVLPWVHREPGAHDTAQREVGTHTKVVVALHLGRRAVCESANREYMTPTLKDDELSSRITSTASVDGVNPRKCRGRGRVQEDACIM